MDVDEQIILNESQFQGFSEVTTKNFSVFTCSRFQAEQKEHIVNFIIVPAGNGAQVDVDEDDPL